jgi:hypothetical protein
MPSSAVIRAQQQQQTSVNPNHHSNQVGEKHTISMFRLCLRAFDYVYLLNTKIFIYALLMLKRLLRFIFGIWTFLFVSLRGSKKKVNQTREINGPARTFSILLAHSISIGEILQLSASAPVSSSTT